MLSRPHIDSCMKSGQPEILKGQIVTMDYIFRRREPSFQGVMPCLHRWLRLCPLWIPGLLYSFKSLLELMSFFNTTHTALIVNAHISEHALLIFTFQKRLHKYLSITLIAHCECDGIGDVCKLVKLDKFEDDNFCTFTDYLDTVRCSLQALCLENWQLIAVTMSFHKCAALLTNHVNPSNHQNFLAEQPRTHTGWKKKKGTHI